jgi:hypothetical protein
MNSIEELSPKQKLRGRKAPAHKQPLACVCRQGQQQTILVAKNGMRQLAVPAVNKRLGIRLLPYPSPG